MSVRWRVPLVWVAVHLPPRFLAWLRRWSWPVALGVLFLLLGVTSLASRRPSRAAPLTGLLFGVVVGLAVQGYRAGRRRAPSSRHVVRRIRDAA